MINLLPTEVKKDYRAARINTALLRYINIMVLSVFVIGSIIGAAYYWNESEKQKFEEDLARSEQNLGSLRKVRDQAKTYNENVDRAKQIYSKEIILSDIVGRITKCIPPGAVMSNLALNSQQLSTPFVIVAKVDSFEKAAVFEKNFKESGIFKDVVLDNVSNTGGAAGATTGSPGDGSQYRFSANISATLVVSEITKKDQKGNATSACGRKG